MAQTYQRNHHDYDNIQRSERQSSRGPLLTVTRGVPYVAYSSRPEPRHESRSYVLPTPIHDIDQDSDQGSARKRTAMACGRCRRRKIKCSGGYPCQACRSAGVEVNSCQYTRVGTSQTFNLDTSVGGPSPLTPISPYSPVSPGGGYPAYPTDDRSTSVPAYGRSGYTQAPLPAYSYDTLETPTYAVTDESRSWANGQRPNTTVGYYEQETPAAYDYATPISRVPSNSSEPLSPLNMSTLQSSLPLALERRLPAPNLVGSPISPDNDIRSPISARLSSLCISGPYSRSNSASWAVEGVERRQPSIHDLAEASMMLPPVTRGLTNTAATLPALAQDTAPLSNAMFVPSQSSDDLTPISAATASSQPTYYAATLPSLTTGMLPPTNYTRYTALNTSSSSLPIISTNDRTADNYYGWTPANAVTTDTAPVITSIEPEPPTNTARKDSAVSQSGRYPALHHPRPKVVPSTSHATTLEKHDRVQQKDDHHRRPSSAHPQKLSSSSHGGSTHGKKSSHKPSKGSL